MSDATDICGRFLPHLEEATRRALAQEPALAAELAALWSAARASCPEIEVGVAEFLAFVARRLDLSALRGQALSRLHAGDLYLLCAYLQGAPGASARSSLGERTREALSRRVQVADGELESILRLIESQMDVSLRRRLEDDP